MNWRDWLGRFEGWAGARGAKTYIGWKLGRV